MRTIDHKTMRAVVGFIALFIAPVVVVLSGKSWDEMTSVSISYWSDSGDLFVGSLFAVAFFLSAYNGQGTGRDWEYYVSRAAGFFAILVALFPTGGFKDTTEDPPAWVVDIASLVGSVPEDIHRLAAVLFFACLTFMMIMFSKRAESKGVLWRMWVYRIFAVGMVLGVTVGGLLILDDPKRWTFSVEVWLLVCFALGWLLAAFYKPVEAQ